MRLIQFCLKNSLLLNLLTLLLIAVGALKAYQMRKEAFPSVNFDIVLVQTTYPGASPKEVEQDITNLLEDELATVDGLDQVNSTSTENRSSIVVRLDPDRSLEQKNKTINDIQRAVDRTQDLPADLPNPPRVTSVVSGDLPVIEIALTGKLSYAELHRLAEDLKEKLIDIDDVKDVNLSGYRDREYWIEVDPAKLDRYNIGLAQITATLKGRNISLPGGLLKTSTGDVLVRTLGEVDKAKELEQFVVRSNDAGVQVRLGDIATVKAKFADEKRILRTNGLTSINLMVTKKASGDIITLVDAVKAVTNHFNETRALGDQLQVSYLNDMSVFVRNRLGVLLNNSYLGIILVLLTLLLFLSKGIATVAALGMPIAFLGTFIFMGYADLTINLISMFGLVIVLGMLVDDAIIVAENIWQYYERGDSAWDAAVKGTSEVFWPVTATILTTVAAFSPLLMVSGIFGKFIKVLPQVVVVALAMSLLEAMLILPSHAYEILRFGKKKQRTEPEKEKLRQRLQNSLMYKATQIYGRILQTTLKMRYAFLALCLLVFTGSLWFANQKMQLILFPNDGVEAFFMRADLPLKTTLTETGEKFRSLEALVQKISPQELKDYVTTIGSQQDDMYDPLTKRGSHLGQVMIFLTPDSQRTRSADDVINDLRQGLVELSQDMGLTKYHFSKQRIGPPVGKPVAIRILGDDLGELNRVADAVIARLRQIPGARDISKNYLPGKDELMVLIDEKRTARALLTVADIALHIRTALAGQIATHVRSEGDRIPVRVRYPEADRRTIESILDSHVPNAAGFMVPLKNVVQIQTAAGLDSIYHRDFKRSVSVSAAVDEKITSSTSVNQALQPSLVEIERDNPDLTIEAGGEYEDTDASIKSLAEAFLIALGLIFLILATLFKSLTQPFVVMAAIPFGMVGVIIAFYLHDLPLSFLGLIGTIGLSGVVVNDSIVLVDFINNARHQGMDNLSAAVYAGKRRFRAVWLTTMTTVFGLLPLVYGFGGEDKFLQPAAVALAYGLIFATVLILLMIPCFYLIRLDVEKIFRRRSQAL